MTSTKQDTQYFTGKYSEGMEGMKARVYESFMEGVCETGKIQATAHPYLEFKEMYHHKEASVDARWACMEIGDYRTQPIHVGLVHHKMRKERMVKGGDLLAGILDISNDGKYENDPAWCGTPKELFKIPRIEQNVYGGSDKRRDDVESLERILGIAGNKSWKLGELNIYDMERKDCMLDRNGNLSLEKWEQFCIWDAGKEFWEEDYDVKPLIEMMKNQEMYENVVKLLKTRIMMEKFYIKGALGDRTKMGKLLVEKYQESAGDLISDFWERYGMKYQRIQGKEVIYNYNKLTAEHSVKRNPEQIYYLEFINELKKIDCIESMIMGRTDERAIKCGNPKTLYLKIKSSYSLPLDDNELKNSPEFSKAMFHHGEFCEKMNALGPVQEITQVFPRHLTIHCSDERRPEIP